MEAERTKLSVGDEFNCYIMIENEPIYLNNLIHEGNGPMLYVAGKKSGIHFRIMDD